MPGHLPAHDDEIRKLENWLSEARHLGSTYGSPPNGDSRTRQKNGYQRAPPVLSAPQPTSASAQSGSRVPRSTNEEIATRSMPSSSQNHAPSSRSTPPSENVGAFDRVPSPGVILSAKRKSIKRTYSDDQGLCPKRVTTKSSSSGKKGRSGVRPGPATRRESTPTDTASVPSSARLEQAHAARPSFVPEINAKSESLASKKAAEQGPVHERLYQQANQLEANRQRLSEKVNREERAKIRQARFNAGGRTSRPEDAAEDFLERAEEYEAHKAAALAEQRARMKEEEAKECTFHPRINSSISNMDELDSADVLYDPHVTKFVTRMKKARKGSGREKRENARVSVVDHDSLWDRSSPRESHSPSALRRPQPYKAGRLHIPSSSSGSGEEVARKATVEMVPCPHCRTMLEKPAHLVAKTRFRDRGTTCRMVTLTRDGGCQVDHGDMLARMKNDEPCPLCGDRDSLFQKLQSLEEELYATQTALEEERQKEPEKVEVPRELREDEKFDEEGRCLICEYLKPKSSDAETQCIVEAVAVPAPAEPAGPGPEAEPEPEKKGMSKKQQKTHRQAMVAAGRQISLVLAKVGAAIGDKVRLNAACRGARDVLETITKLLNDLLDSVDNPEKRVQIQQLCDNIGNLTGDLDEEAKVLGKDPHNDSAVKKLTVTLRQLEDTVDIALHEGTNYAVKADLAEAVSKVSIFDGVSNVGFFNDIVRRMSEAVFPPQEFIVKFGEVGSSMYFITKGSVSIILEDGTKVARLEEGGFFGEIALLISGQRTASVCAETYVQAYELDKGALDHALTKYPEYKNHFHKVANRRMQDNEAKKKAKDLSIRLQKLPVFPFRKVFSGDMDAMKARPRASKLEMQQVAAGIIQHLVDLGNVLHTDYLKEENASIRANFEAFASNPDISRFKRAVTATCQAATRLIVLCEMQEGLAHIPIFSGTDVAFQDMLLKHVTIETFESGTKVAKTADPCERLCFITSGSIARRKINPKERDKEGELVDNLLAGMVFGEDIIRGDASNLYDYVANTQVELACLSSMYLEEAFNQYPGHRDMLIQHLDEENAELRKSANLEKSASKFKSLVRRRRTSVAGPSSSKEGAARSNLKALQSISAKDIGGLSQDELKEAKETLEKLLSEVAGKLGE